LQSGSNVTLARDEHVEKLPLQIVSTLAGRQIDRNDAQDEKADERIKFNLEPASKDNSWIGL
jgi:hypothetical protein